ncbi:MAG: hypothetical protein SGJ05_01960 [bacterium]|nr:hypothetical protein [bacterium]
MHKPYIYFGAAVVFIALLGFTLVPYFFDSSDLPSQAIELTDQSRGYQVRIYQDASSGSADHSIRVTQFVDSKEVVLKTFAGYREVVSQRIVGDSLLLSLKEPEHSNTQVTTHTVLLRKR